MDPSTSSEIEYLKHQGDMEALPGGCQRLMFNDVPKSSPDLMYKSAHDVMTESKFKQTLRKLPSMSVFWKPTDCPPCYYLRLVLVMGLAAIHPIVAGVGIFIFLLCFIRAVMDK